MRLARKMDGKSHIERRNNARNLKLNNQMKTNKKTKKSKVKKVGKIKNIENDDKTNKYNVKSVTNSMKNGKNETKTVKTSKNLKTGSITKLELLKRQYMQEEKEIKNLEIKLGLKKSKPTPSIFFNEGVGGNLSLFFKFFRYY